VLLIPNTVQAAPLLAAAPVPVSSLASVPAPAPAPIPDSASFDSARHVGVCY